MRTCLSLMMIALLALPALAGTITESRSKVEFPASITVEEATLHACGTGLRMKAIFKVYAACFYAEEGAHFGKDRFNVAINGDFSKRIVMQFLRKVGGEKIGAAFAEGIRKSLPEGHDEAVNHFAGLFTEKLRKGDQIVLTYIPGKGLHAEQAGVSLGDCTDSDVIAAIWATWFGSQPVGEDLKQGLLSELK